MNDKILLGLGIPLLGVTLLAGCKHTDNPSMASYEVTVTNLTEAQPLSPVAVILHREGYLPWKIGDSAGSGLEQLAEGGDNSTLLEEAKHHSKVKQALSDSGVIAPGAHSSIIVEARHYRDLRLSLATMLVNTNDAFSGLSAKPISALGLHETLSVDVAAFDAGTESNSETAAVPGPAAGGEGYNSIRDDRNSVGGHPGVLGAEDGVAGSVLHAEHRFDNPVARIRITRLE